MSAVTFMPDVHLVAAKKMPEADFVAYLKERWHALLSGNAKVPCGGCNACCRGGYTVDLTDAEAKTLPHVVDDDGTPVIKPNADGTCPLLLEGKCSVYDQRPRACRVFDCREIAFAGVRFGPGQWDRREINAAADRFNAQHGVFPAALTVSRRILGRSPRLPIEAVATAVMVLGMKRYLPRDRTRTVMQSIAHHERTRTRQRRSA